MDNPENFDFERARIVARAQIAYGRRLVADGEELLALLDLLKRLEHASGSGPPSCQDRVGDSIGEQTVVEVRRPELSVKWGAS